MSATPEQVLSKAFIRSIDLLEISDTIAAKAIGATEQDILNMREGAFNFSKGSEQHSKALETIDVFARLANYTGGWKNLPDWMKNQNSVLQPTPMAVFEQQGPGAIAEYVARFTL